MYLESAAHLVSHHALDPEFVYMPGYVLLLAAVKGLGGGLLDPGGGPAAGGAGGVPLLDRAPPAAGHHQEHGAGLPGGGAGAGAVGGAQPPALRRGLLHRQPRRAHGAGGRQPRRRGALLALPQPDVRGGHRAPPAGRASPRGRPRLLRDGPPVHPLRAGVRARRWAAFTFVPLQLALVAIYALFFAEVRYQLPIVMLMFPPAGAALAALSRVKVPSRGDVAWALPAVLLPFVVWPLVLYGGQ